MNAAATILCAPLERPLAAPCGTARPSFAWDFRRMGALPPALGFGRAATAWRRGPQGLLAPVAAGQPVFEHDASGLATGLRIEGARTNICPDNNDLRTLGRGANTTVTLEAGAVAPDGATGAVFRLQMPAAGNTFLRLVTGVGAGTHACSAWVRSSTANRSFQFYSNGGGSQFAPTLTATESWQRFRHTMTSTGTGDFGINNGDDTYASDLQVWRPQVEAGAFASSLIATAGSTATRAADDAARHDLASLPGVSAGNGTWLVDWIAEGAAADFSRVVELNDGTSDNQINLSRSGGDLAFNVVTGGSFQASLVAGPWSEGRHRAAFRHAADDLAVCLDGGAVAADATGTPPPLTDLLAGRSIGSGWSHSTLVAIAHWPAPLPDAALRAITVRP